MQDKMKILWLSDSPTTCTGYATITRNILNGLTEKGHECYCIGHNYLGQDLLPGTTFKDGTKMNFTLIGNGKEQYGKDIIQKKIKDIQPDYFCVLLDTFMLYPWITQMDLAPAKTLFYFPSDGENRLPLECDKVLKKFHIQVAMAKFGQKQCKFVHQLDTEYIPHAIDIENYYKVDDEEKQKIKNKWNLKDKFVVGSVFRNQGRKMPDRMLKAFAEFSKDKDDVVLLLHTDPYDNAAPFDMMHYIKELDIENKVRFTGMNFNKGFEYKEMNSVYNVMDLFLLSTSGEGWGCPTIEAMACGVPPVITDYTTTQEIVIENGECGIAVPIETEIIGSWNVSRGCMSISKCAEALNKLYHDDKLRNKMGKVGIEKVNKYYNWDTVINEWDALLSRYKE